VFATAVGTLHERIKQGDCDDEADNLIATLTSLLEPFMIVTIALMVGSLVIALFLPLMRIMNGIEGGDR
jgi:type IV pilus assembly protein PilC